MMITLAISLRAVCIAFLCLAGNLVWSPPTAASSVNDGGAVYAFGRHLLELGDYYRAITELKRFSLLFPHDPRQPAAQVLLGLAYEAASDDEAATTYFRRLRQSDRDDVRRLALYKLGELRLQQRQYPQAARLFQGFLAQYPQGPLVDRTRYLLGVAHALQNDTSAAQRQFDTLAPDGPWSNRAKAFEDALDMAAPLSFKSPQVAGVLAGILPGAGHLYLGKPRHAITAFLLNGLFIAGATVSFLESMEAVGVILLYFETGWYLGNINSAKEGAREFNRRQLQELENQRFKTFVPPGLSLKQLPGLGLNIQF